MLEIVKAVPELNLPTVRADRNLVAARDGGLSYPSVLTFHPEWSAQKSASACVKRSVVGYPLLPEIQKPENDEDIAFMSVTPLMLLLLAFMKILLFLFSQLDWLTVLRFMNWGNL